MAGLEPAISASQMPRITNFPTSSCPPRSNLPNANTFYIARGGSLFEEGVRLELTLPSSGSTAFQEQPLIRPDAFHYVFPQGFEPQFSGPKPDVLPIRRGENLCYQYVKQRLL